MKKLFELKTKDFLTGIASTEHIENDGLFNSTTAGAYSMSWTQGAADHWAIVSLHLNAIAVTTNSNFFLMM